MPYMIVESLEMSDEPYFFFKKSINDIVAMPKPFALTCNPLSEVRIMGLAVLNFNATERMMLSGDFLLKSAGSKVRSASSMERLLLRSIAY